MKVEASKTTWEGIGTMRGHRWGGEMMGKVHNTLVFMKPITVYMNIHKRKMHRNLG